MFQNISNLANPHLTHEAHSYRGRNFHHSWTTLHSTDLKINVDIWNSLWTWRVMRTYDRRYLRFAQSRSSPRELKFGQRKLRVATSAR
ncbi:hypothetical protein IGI04_006220 [Brassica rapa subsp. trilocularis]|uniref:Uncharacterized protein n=1 Tax=Brassica rapa subsp. trilocularis TaxID=1813537 RepID=A0ABQ7NHN2_BRACM|nr:hypothetical protein IGI04_006220 [Brassica rapa subsp. trilocularis]